MWTVCRFMTASSILCAQTIAAQGLGDLPDWRVPPDPVMSIGLVQGDEPYLLYDVTSLRVNSSGQVFVANAGTGELRIFGPDGVFVKTVGGRGQGPGEYQHLTGMELFAEDSLLVFDRDLRRLSVFSPSGQFLRSHRVAAPEGSTAAVEALVGVDNGRALLVGARYDGEFEYPSRTGIERISNTVFSVDLADGMVELVAEVSGIERGYLVRDRGVGFAPLPHRRWAVIAPFRGGLLVGDNATPTIRLLTASGAAHRTFQAPFPIHRLSREERLAGIERIMARYPDITPQQAAEQSRMILDFEGPMVAPRYARIVPSDDGRFWLQDYQPSGSDPEMSFVGMDESGVPFASLRIPSGLASSAEFDVPSNARLHIGSERVYGVWKGEQNVEFVRVYRILRE